MANYNNNNWNRNNGQSQSRGNWGGNRSNGGGTQNTKKSGAVYSRIKKGKMEGETAVNAWRRTKNGLVTASAFPVDGVEHKSQSGKTHLRYVVDLVNRDMGTTQTYWCLMDKGSKKIFIQELGLVISPNGQGVTAGGKRVTGFFGRVF